MPDNRDTAEAFSGHRFEEALGRVAPDARWTLIGAGVMDGAAEIAAACRSTATDLEGTATEFTRFDVVGEGDLIAVDTEATYTDAEGVATTVASCDLYAFRDGLVVGIRSYTVEVDAPAEPG